VKISTVIRILVLLLLAAAAVAIFLLVPVQRYLYDFLEWVRGTGIWGPVVFGAAYVLACVLFVPGSLLTLGAGFVFGVVVGTITVSVSSVAGAAAAFILGRTLLRDWVEARVARNPRFRALDAAVQRQGFVVVLLCRLSPLFPFNLLNYAFGLTRVSFRDYVLASWLGMLPGTVLYVYLGSTLKSLADLAAGRVEGGVAGWVLFGVGLVATVAVTVVVTRAARKALRQAVPEEPGPQETPQRGAAHV
jgi:uncharacterized membrane protein YdjX (TVP38/TMEM64 family)